jgi:lipoyl(octanoyl) transferase
VRADQTQKHAQYRALGTIEYGVAYALQQKLVEERRVGQIPDTLLLCEHPDVITVGRRQAAQAHILEPRFPVFEIERGGDVTYHGPGQLVGYPIVFLEGAERDLHGYLRALEEGLIALCAACGVAAGRRPGYTGVWTMEKEAEQRKLASIGIAVRRWVTFHGFALNVTTDLTRFQTIHPCGFQAAIMTSLLKEGADSAALVPTTLLPRAATAIGTALARHFTPEEPSI